MVVKLFKALYKSKILQKLHKGKRISLKFRTHLFYRSQISLLNFLQNVQHCPAYL